jgi:hypothetical protein
MIVWTSLERGHTISEIADKLTSTFDLSPEHAVNSVQGILHKFQSLNLTRESSS